MYYELSYAIYPRRKVTLGCGMSPTLQPPPPLAIAFLRAEFNVPEDVTIVAVAREQPWAEWTEAFEKFAGQ